MYIVLENKSPQFQLIVFSQEKWRFLQSNHFLTGIELFTKDYLIEFLEKNSPEKIQELQKNRHAIIENPFSTPIYIFEFDETTILNHCDPFIFPQGFLSSFYISHIVDIRRNYE